MKTLTELSGITIRRAAAAIAEAKRSLPRVEAPAVEAVPEVAAPPSAAPPQLAAPEASVAFGEAATAASAQESEGAPPLPAPAAPAAASPPKPKGRPVEPPETDEVKATLDAAVAAATGLSGDRLARLRDAVKVADRRIEDVRLVRVFGPEEPVPGATTLNGFQYVVDLAPATMRQTAEPKRERGGRGGRGGGGAGGSGGKGAPKSGGFSMDAMKDDRKGQRSGPGGGGRGRPPGGGGGGKPR